MKANKIICFIIILLMIASLFMVNQTHIDDNTLTTSYENVSKDEILSEIEISSQNEESDVCSECTTIESTDQIEAIYEETVIEEMDLFENIPLSKDLRNHIKYVSNFYGFEEKLIYQIIYVESRFSKDAKNKNCCGLMQVMKKYSSSFMKWGDEIDNCIQSNDIMNSYTNTVIGIRILKTWKDESERLGYNQDEVFIEMYNKGYNIGNSRNYASRVLSVNLDDIDFSNYSIVE